MIHLKVKKRHWSVRLIVRSCWQIIFVMLKGILAAKVLAPPSSPLAAFRDNKNQLWSLRTCIDKNLGNVAFSKLHLPILNIFSKMNLNRKIKSFSQKNLAVHHVCSNFDALDEILCESLMCDSYSCRQSLQLL